MFSRNRLSAISCGLISSIFLFSHSMAGASETGDLSSRDRTDLLQSAGIDCGAKGNGDCVAGNTERGDYYDVRVYGDCAKAAYFGRTNDKSTSLRKDVATTGTEGKTEGELAPNQLVCIRAAAQVGMHETEYFVMALPDGLRTRMQRWRAMQKACATANQIPVNYGQVPPGQYQRLH
ncbi:hypothetical protein HED48_21905 [Ochrobactrum intermedium]|nr:hypothetical protein [Brucella intermedia]